MLADTTPFRDGLGQMAGILPPWVLADGWEEALQAPRATARCASGCAASATATGASSTRATGTACACRRARSTPASRARTSPRSRRSSAPTSGTRYFDILADAGPGDREPAPDRRALHRRAPGRDDLAPALLARRRRLHRARSTSGLDGDRRPSGLLRRARSLPHPPRAASCRTLPLEEAIRKMTSMPAQHFGLQRPRRAPRPASPPTSS